MLFFCFPPDFSSFFLFNFFYLIFILFIHLFVCEEEAAWRRTEWPHTHGPAAAEEALVVADCGGGGRRVENREFVRAHQFALQRRHLRVSAGRKALIKKKKGGGGGGADRGGVVG